MTTLTHLTAAELRPGDIITIDVTVRALVTTCDVVNDANDTWLETELIGPAERTTAGLYAGARTYLTERR